MCVNELHNSISAARALGVFAVEEKLLVGPPPTLLQTLEITRTVGCLSRKKSKSLLFVYCGGRPREVSSLLLLIV